MVGSNMFWHCDSSGICYSLIPDDTTKAHAALAIAPLIAGVGWRMGLVPAEEDRQSSHLVSEIEMMRRYREA